MNRIVKHYLKIEKFSFLFSILKKGDDLELTHYLVSKRGAFLEWNKGLPKPLEQRKDYFRGH